MQHLKFEIYPEYWIKISRLILLFSLLYAVVKGQDATPAASRDLSGEDQTLSIVHEDVLNHTPAWFGSKEAIQIADNMLVFQRKTGGWPKNIDMIHPLSHSEMQELTEYEDEPLSTIDNGATYTQMIFLAQVFHETQEERYMLAFLKGLDYLLEAQYDNGGWPQFYPLRKGYYSHITFNDDAMIGVMRLLSDVAGRSVPYGFVDDTRRENARIALQKGIDCILKTQIKVEGRLTAWCAQYHEKTLKPANARRYELVSLSGEESVSIVRFLMDIEPPSEEIIKAIQGAVAWLNRVRIEGIRVIYEPDSTAPRGWNRVVIHDPDAPSMWARFYQIGSNKPFFSDRDGKMYYDLSQISSERRNTYGWLGYWPQELLERDYSQWQEKWVPGENVLHR